MALKQIKLLASLKRNEPIWSFWGGLPANAAAITAKMRQILGIEPDDPIPLTDANKYPIHVEMRARKELYEALSSEEQDEIKELRVKHFMDGNLDT